MLPQLSPTEVETGLGRWSGLLCESSISEHSQEFHSPKQKYFKASHQLEGKMAPLFLKQFLSTGPHRVVDVGDATLNKSAMVPPTLASDQISDHFLPQNRSSRKTPTRKKILQGYFNGSQNHLENREVRSKSTTWQQAFNSKIYPKEKSCFRESELPLVLAAERFLEHFIFCSQLPVLLMFHMLDFEV